MRAHPKNRCYLLPASALLLAAAAVSAQVKPSPMVPARGQLPATAPTTQALPAAPLAAKPLNEPVARKPQRATVTYAAGLLNVRANDSSLNSILREISRQTGMTISGGVADQRVFGNYGPADPTTVLSTLLDGTGTNLFIKEAADTSPRELVLTPRGGGPTPPNPSAAQYNDSDEPIQPPAIGFAGRQNAQGPGYSQVPPTATQQMPAAASVNTGFVPAGSPPSQPASVLGDPNAVSPSASTLPVTNSVATDALPVPATAQSPSGIVSAPSAPPAGTTTYGFSAAAQAAAAAMSTPTNDADTTGSNSPGGSTSNAGSGSAPNGVKTPEQIFEQLQQLRRANQTQQGAQPGAGQTTPAPSTPATTPTIPQ
jgi:hypothetical protein